MYIGEQTFITVAIHTYDHAIALRELLEAHGIAVRLDNISENDLKVAPAVRIRIAETDLPLALKVIESGTISTEQSRYGSRTILVPVDFSESAVMACKIAFMLARRLALKPLLFHTYVSPYFTGTLSLSQDIDGMVDENIEENIAEMEASEDLRTNATKQMNAFRKKLEDAQKTGEVVRVPFSTKISEGIPEDAIRQFCRLTPPALVIMATRGKSKKEEDLVGSITAEVLDSCRVPILTIPDNCSNTDVVNYRRVAFFCNLDHQDIISIDSLMRMFAFPDVTVSLIPVNERAGTQAGKKVKDLAQYFNTNYPTARFIPKIFPVANFREAFEDFLSKENLQLLIVPNKKQNIFKRLFNPGIAHRILFERDVPLLALPV